jgi:hypothetical protein
MKTAKLNITLTTTMIVQSAMEDYPTNLDSMIHETKTPQILSDINHDSHTSHGYLATTTSPTIKCMMNRYANWVNKCGGTFLQLERLMITSKCVRATHV